MSSPSISPTVKNESLMKITIYLEVEKEDYVEAK